MIGNLIVSAATGIGAGVGIYLLYGMERFSAQRATRIQSAMKAGVAVALLGFVARWFGWI